MSDVVIIHDEEDIERIIRNRAQANPAIFEEMFNSFLIIRYGFGLDRFDKIMKEALPEEFI